MNKTEKYKGVVVPMITPVTRRGEIDVQAVERVMHSFISQGVSPLLMGTTGEGTSVSYDQALVLVQAAAGAAAGRVTLYAGLHGCCASEHAKAAEAYRQAGADVIVATLPSYYALTDRQMVTYYSDLADGISAPSMLYNIKATTHMSIPVDVVRQLSKHPNIVGLKDSERDLERMQACLEISRQNPGFSYFCGWAAQSAKSLELGADGIVPSTGNFVPDLFAQLYRAALEGNKEEAERLQQETDGIARLYQEGRTLGESLTALKVMMQTKDLCEPWMLPPLTRLPEEEEHQLIQCLLPS